MGLLKDEGYWVAQITSVHQQRVLRTSPMPRDSAVVIMEIACRVFTELLNDPEFENDLREAITLAQASAVILELYPQHFGPFLRAFSEAERAVLMQSGVSFEATEDICADIRELMTIQLDHSEFDRVAEKINALRLKCCRSADDPVYRNDPEPSLANDAGQAVYGMGVLGLDASVVAITGTTVDLVVGTSVGYGLKKLGPLLRRVW